MPILTKSHRSSAIAKAAGSETESPAERLAKVKAKETETAKAKEAGATLTPELSKRVRGVIGNALKLSHHKETAKAERKRDAMWIPTSKQFQKIVKKDFVPATFMPTRKDNDSADTEVRPETPEVSGSGLKTPTRYFGDRPKATKDVKTGEGSGRPELDKVTGPKLGVCPDCLGAVSTHRYAKTSAGTPDITKIVHPGIRAGSPKIGGHQSQHSAPTGFGPKIPTSSSSQRLAQAGAVGRAGGKPRDIKDRNILTPEKPEKESIFTNLSDLLQEYILKATMAPIKKYEPKKHGELVPLRHSNPLPPGASNAEKEKAITGVETTRELWLKMRQPKKSGHEQFKALFGEEYMDPNKIANDIIREAFTSGDRNNTTDGNDMSGKGQTARKMLAGEWFGSEAWPFDQTTNPMFAKSANLQATQSETGMGELNAGAVGWQESVASEIVANLLEDSPSAILSDPESVGYLINEMCEAGYCDDAETLKSICADAKEEDVIKVSAMIDKLEAEKADPFLVEQLTKFATQFLITEEDAAPASDENLPKDDAAEKVDDNAGTAEA